jgi:hypothetical protein
MEEKRKRTKGSYKRPCGVRNELSKSIAKNRELGEKLGAK